MAKKETLAGKAPKVLSSSKITIVIDILSNGKKRRRIDADNFNSREHILAELSLSTQTVINEILK